jgi:hypothetical protein
VYPRHGTQLIHTYNPNLQRLSPVLSLLGLILVRALSPDPLLILSSRSQSLERLVDRTLLLGFVPVACVKVGGCVFEQPFSPDVGDGTDELNGKRKRIVVLRIAFLYLRYPLSTQTHYTQPILEMCPDQSIDADEQSEGRKISVERSTYTRHDAYLVVLDRRVRALLTRPVCNLHEETARQSLSNVHPVVLVLPSCRAQVQVEL